MDGRGRPSVQNRMSVEGRSSSARNQTFQICEETGGPRPSIKLFRFVEGRASSAHNPTFQICEEMRSATVNKVFWFVEGRASPPVHNEAQPESRSNSLARDESLLLCHREN
jgi:hypothetical protein